MNKKGKRTLILVVLLVFITAAASCNLPMKVTEISKNTQPPLSTTPPPPDESTTAPFPETPTPEIAAAPEEVVPVTGSILRWIDYSDFVYVPSGAYQMGQDSNTPSDHSPAHNVNVTGFWIHQAEVTNQQYSACVAAGECTPPSREIDTPYWYGMSQKGNMPVVGVSWFQAQEYCQYIEARLPTESEWEKAARGLESKTYPWGEDLPNCELLDFKDCEDPAEPVDVRSFNNGASDYEAMDLSGNVFEWVDDWYAEDYYAQTPAENPLGPEEGIYKIYRGGSYLSQDEQVNSIDRYFAKPEEHAADIGFRCVLTGDFYSEENGQQVPRPCEALPINNHQPEQQPTWTPFPCQSPYIAGNCYLNAGGGPVTSLYIAQSGCQSNRLVDFSSNTIIDLNCTGPTPVGDYKTYTCNGKNMIQGAVVDLTFCHKYSVQLMSPQCPQGYEYDSTSQYCLPTGSWLPDPPCPVGYKEYDGQCLPDPTVQQGCPVGFYYQLNLTGPTTYEEVCIPLDDCLLKSNQIECPPPTCPAGQNYDPNLQCCSLPTNLRPVCPVGFGAQVDSNTQLTFCELPDLFPVQCETLNVVMDYCPTITPTATTKPNNPDCGSYSNQKICEVNGCTWASTAAICY